MLKTTVIAKAVECPNDPVWQSYLRQYIQADIDASRQKLEADSAKATMKEGARLIEALAQHKDFFGKLYDSGLIEKMANINQARDLYNNITQRQRPCCPQSAPVVNCAQLVTPTVNASSFILAEMQKYNKIWREGLSNNDEKHANTTTTVPCVDAATQRNCVSFHESVAMPSKDSTSTTTTTTSSGTTTTTSSSSSNVAQK